MKHLALSAVCAFVLVLIGSVSTARADAPGAYVAVGGVAGAHDYSYTGIAAEGGGRLGGPLFGRLLLAAGLATQWDEAGGWFQQTRIGAEARPCTTSGRLCGFAGLDLGLAIARYSAVNSAMEVVERDPLAWLVVPRAGIDAAAGTVRVRAAIEAVRYVPILSGRETFGVAIGVSAVHAF